MELIAIGMCIVLFLLSWLGRNEPDNNMDDWLQ